MHHALTQPMGALTLVKGGWLGRVLRTYPSEMAQNFWTAIYAWTACFVISVVISLVTRQQKTDAELTGLVSSLTPRSTLVADVVWYQRPITLGVIVLVLVFILNVLF